MFFGIKNPRHAAVSLVEALFILVLCSMFIVVTNNLLNQSRKLSRNVYVSSTRNMLLASLTNEIDSDVSGMYELYDTGASPVTTVTENGSPSGIVIPYSRKIFCRSAMESYPYYYIYADAQSTTPMFKSMTDFFNREIRIDSGLTSGYYQDNSNQVWAPDTYSDWDCKAGWYDGVTTGTSATSILNSNNPKLFQTYREGDPVSYIVSLQPGDYTVQLYFAELDPTVTASAPNRRRMDIWMEDIKHASSFSPYEATGATGKGVIVTYEVAVNDWFLNIDLWPAADSDLDPRVSAVVIKWRDVW